MTAQVVVLQANMMMMMMMMMTVYVSCCEDLFAIRVSRSVPRAQECLSEGAGSEEPSQAVQTRTQESTEWAIQCWSLRKLFWSMPGACIHESACIVQSQSCSDVPDARGSLLRCECEIDQTFFERKAGEGSYELTAQLTW